MLRYCVTELQCSYSSNSCNESCVTTTFWFCIRLVRCCFELYWWRHQRQTVAKGGYAWLKEAVGKVPVTRRFSINFSFWFDICTADAAPLDNHAVCYVDCSILFVLK